jgi:hypothetical protein
VTTLEKRLRYACLEMGLNWEDLLCYLNGHNLAIVTEESLPVLAAMALAPERETWPRHGLRDVMASNGHTKWQWESAQAELARRKATK